MTRDQRRQQIVEKHTEGLMRDLQEAGYDTIGIAGGIVLGAEEGQDSSRCHVFCMLSPTATTDGETPIDGRLFLHEVAETMLHGRSVTANLVTREHEGKMANKHKSKKVGGRARETSDQRRIRLAEQDAFALQQELRSVYADLRFERGRAWEHMRLAHVERESGAYLGRMLRDERGMVETERKHTEALKDQARSYITTVLTYADQARLLLSKAKEPTDDLRLAQVALSRVFEEKTPASLDKPNPLWGGMGAVGLGIIGMGAVACWLYANRNAVGAIK
jgi:hypothetical protein